MSLRKSTPTPTVDPLDAALSNTPTVDPLDAALSNSDSALGFFSQAAQELDDACAELDAFMDAERSAIAERVVRIDRAREQQKINARVLGKLNDLFNIDPDPTDTAN